MYRQAAYSTDLRDLDSKGARALTFPAAFGPDVELGPEMGRSRDPAFPEISELDVVRHHVGLSQMNYGVDIGIYPLGSCTMKYNPKVAKRAASDVRATSHHPSEPSRFVQGNLLLAWNLSNALCLIAGMDDITLQPAAGAQAEFVGARIIAEYHRSRGQKRDEMIVPDTAHGTNPASSAMAGFRIVEVPSSAEGTLDTDALKSAVSKRTAGIMLTNPNTLGIFESKISEIERIVHGAGGLLYYDGANLNALLGRARPGDMGFDIVHYNLHKTFATPHGGGGPGAGAIGVKQFLSTYLPYPTIEKGRSGFFLSDRPRSNSIGCIRPYLGNFSVLVMAYAYILSVGRGIRDVSKGAVLNSNYLMARLKGHFEVPYIDTTPLRKHEFVLSCEKIKKETGVSAQDIGRRLLDYGMHAPTVYFPLIVKEALMIEPTETETLHELDMFADALIEIKKECYTAPDTVMSSPHATSRRALDTLGAARHPVLSWRMER